MTRESAGPGNRCLRCGDPIDVDRQITASGHGLVYDEITDPLTGETHLVYYCWPCGALEFSLPPGGAS